MLIIYVWGIVYGVLLVILFAVSNNPQQAFTCVVLEVVNKDWWKLRSSEKYPGSNSINVLYYDPA